MNEQREHSNEECIELAKTWFNEKKWTPFPFQINTWSAYLKGSHGLVNAPTGSGKTYSVFVGILLEYIKLHGTNKQANGLQAIWITPIRALSKEIEAASQRAIDGLGLSWSVGVRTGDTSTKERERLKRTPPQLLITTPESLHLMLAQKQYAKYFKNLKAFVADEWHELMGSKRGVQIELGLSKLKVTSPNMKIWGISATIGNMDESLHTLLGNQYDASNFTLIKADHDKVIEVISLLPETIETMPWAGHLGINMLQQVIPIIKKSRSSLIFTNTRSFAEIWYQKLLAQAPELAGVIAMHHSSISRDLRDWVEGALHKGQLKAVVCTSSLDLGVDFRPVETIIQIGSPKGVGRFMQRAGRSGHQPGAVSRIYFVPTNSLELMEAAALRKAINIQLMEDRIPFIRSFDVLIQYLVTLAVSDGFDSAQTLKEIRTTFCYSSISDEEWKWTLNFVTSGGKALTAYDEYHKVAFEDDLFKVVNRKIAMRHRLSIGTIVSDSSMYVNYVSGKRVGTIEEWFITRLKPGDVFWFAGRSLELVRVHGMTAQVRNTKRKAGIVPSWQGGRMSLSSQLSEMLRDQLSLAFDKENRDIEMEVLEPLMKLQDQRSHLPKKDEFLIEYFKSKEGYHVLMYPFEGRAVHEGLGAVIAYRMAQIKPISFSIAMNDYGFELLSDTEIPIYEALETNLLGPENLVRDIEASINSTEMMRHRFREIASISGLVFKGFPGKQQKERHIQSSAQLFFDVFNDYDPQNLLLNQAYEEVLIFQLEEARMRRALERINQQKIIVKEPVKPTPFAFPIMVDRLREKLTSEKLADRIKKMQLQFDD